MLGCVVVGKSDECFGTVVTREANMVLVESWLAVLLLIMVVLLLLISHDMPWSCLCLGRV